ncbi:hypothetical protein GGI35DRAFT_272540 [Trichoderma velutinum]
MSLFPSSAQTMGSSLSRLWLWKHYVATTTNVRNGPLTHAQKQPASPPRLWWRGRGGEPEAGCRPRDPAIRSSVWRMESLQPRMGGLLSGHAGLFPDSPSRWPFYGLGEREAILHGLRFETRAKSYVFIWGEIEMEPCAGIPGMVHVQCLVLVSSPFFLVAIVGCTDGRTVVLPRRPFCLPLGETGVPAPGGTFLLDNFSLL